MRSSNPPAPSDLTRRDLIVARIAIGLVGWPFAAKAPEPYRWIVTEFGLVT